MKRSYFAITVSIFALSSVNATDWVGEAGGALTPAKSGSVNALYANDVQTRHDSLLKKVEKAYLVELGITGADDEIVATRTKDDGNEEEIQQKGQDVIETLKNSIEADVKDLFTSYDVDVSDDVLTAFLSSTDTHFSFISTFPLLDGSKPLQIQINDEVKNHNYLQHLFEGQAFSTVVTIPEPQVWTEIDAKEAEEKLISLLRYKSANNDGLDKFIGTVILEKFKKYQTLFEGDADNLNSLKNLVTQLKKKYKSYGIKIQGKQFDVGAVLDN